MKIVEVISFLGSGGAEKFTVELSNELARQGHQVILLTLFDLDENCCLGEYVDTSIVQLTSLHKKPGLDVKAFFSLYRFVKENKPDVVHSHVGAIKYTLLSSLLFRRCQYYCTIHSEAKREAGGGIELFSRKFLFKNKLATPVAISPSSELSFVDFYGFHTPMIWNGCSADVVEDMSLQKFHEDVDYLFVHAGRIQVVKNQLVLVKAFTRLLDMGVKARLIIMGRKEDQKVFEAISSYFGPNIVYLGEQKNCKAYMQQADAFCLSSRMEGMPITILEAMSVSCIPIVTPVGGCVNVVENGHNGLVADSVSEDDYFKILVHFVSLTKEDRLIMKTNAYDSFCQKYSIESCARHYIELFKNSGYEHK